MAGAVAFALTPLSARLAIRFGVIDQPDQGPGSRKKHRDPTPYLGGVAIFAGVLAAAPVVLALPGDQSLVPTSGFPLAIAIALGLGLVGLVDDIRQLPRTVRLAAQIAAALIAWAVDFRVLATPIEVVNLGMTVIWIVGITNAFNLLDNMDGLSAGLAGVGGLAFAVMGVLGGQGVLALAAAGVTGAAFGFLAHNRHPAKVFMGDAGALFLGFLLAIVGIRLRFDNLVEVTFLVPVVVLGLPIFDTTLVVLSRLRNGRRPFTGARDHISHRLVQVGLPVTAAVGLLYWSGLCLGWLGLVISRSSVEVGWMLLAFVMALGLFFGALLWNVPVYEELVDPEDPAAKESPSQAVLGR